MPSNIYDVLGKTFEGAAKAAVAHQNAQNTLKSQLLLYKIKQLFEEQGEEKKAKTKFGYDVALEGVKAKAPFEAYKEFSQNSGGLPGNIRIDPATGKPKDETPSLWDLQKEARTTVNSMLQNNPELQGKVFQDPNLLTNLIDQEVMRLTGRYRGNNTNLKTPNPQPEETTQPTAWKIPTGITEGDIEHTMKLHNLTRDEVLNRIQK